MEHICVSLFTTTYAEMFCRRLWNSEFAVSSCRFQNKSILTKLGVCPPPMTAEAVTQQKIRPSTDPAESASRMQQPGGTADSEARIKLEKQQLAMLQEENRQPEATPTIPPSLFDGTLETCRGHLLQCKNTFDLRPGMTEKHKILYIVGLLWGRALEWAQAEDLRHPLASRTLGVPD